MAWPTDPKLRDEMMRQLGMTMADDAAKMLEDAIRYGTGFGRTSASGFKVGDPLHIPLREVFGMDPAEPDTEATVTFTVTSVTEEPDVITLDPSEYRRIK